MRRWLVVGAMAWCALGCTSTAKTDAVSSSFRGTPLAAPLPKPSFILTDYNGKAYNFARETDGKVGLLFFGYTHCPDVCPVHMANIAAVLRQMPWEERSFIRVVFVTTDPERDTPQRLKEWLGHVDPSFVGLTGTPEALAHVQQSLGMSPARREVVNGDSVNYSVGHGAQVFAFARDGNAYLVYPFGIRQEDWAHDLPKLARDSSGVDIRRALSVHDSR
jgi:protein SCO1/2